MILSLLYGFLWISVLTLGKAEVLLWILQVNLWWELFWKRIFHCVIFIFFLIWSQIILMWNALVFYQFNNSSFLNVVCNTSGVFFNLWLNLIIIPLIQSDNSCYFTDVRRESWTSKICSKSCRQGTHLSWGFVGYFEGGCCVCFVSSFVCFHFLGCF